MAENLPSRIKISFCMPTRNRASFIGEAIESIIAQSDDRVEIMIVDGASTDNTAEIVATYQKKFKNISYHFEKENGGVDRDMAKALTYAQGEYCWLFSDDDAVKPGAVSRILAEIESKCDVYLCNVIACDLSLRPFRDRYWLSSKVDDNVFHLHDKKEFIAYCSYANSIGALFSYWSSTILRRGSWSSVGLSPDFDGTAYGLAASVFSFAQRKCTIKYIKEPQVFWRNDNASFQNEGGLVKRFLIDLDGYLKIANELLPSDPQVQNAFRRVMTREHPWYTIVHVASLIKDPLEWRSFRSKILQFNYHPVIADICYELSRNYGLVLAGVKLKRVMLKNPWINKVLHFFGLRHVSLL